MWASFDRRCTTWPSATTETKMVARVEEIVATDARYTARLMGSMVGISLGAARTILKRNLKMRKIFERWIPHLLTDEQKKACTQGAKMLLKQFPNYNAQSLANVINNERYGLTFLSLNERFRTKYGQQSLTKDYSLQSRPWV